MQFKLNGYSHGDRFVLVSQINLCSTGEFYIPEIDKRFMASNKESFFALKPFDVVYINSYGKLQRVYENQTHSIDLMMTIHCNSNCIMCPISEGARQSDEYGYFEWLLTLIDVLPVNVEHICITGGEPTLIGDRIFVIIDKLVKKFYNAEFQFLTNGRSCADPELCRRIVQALPSHTLYGIPLHSGNKEVHDRIAQVDGAFEQVISGIKNLLSNGARVELRIVVSKMNVDTLLDEACFIVNNLKGIFCVTFMGIEAMGNAVKNYDKVWIDYHIATSYFEKAIDKLVASDVDVMIYNFPLCSINERYWLLARRSITERKVRYFDECQTCSVKEACSGFFESTFNVVKPSVRPVVI